jgi:hypothetical protein
MYSMKFLTSFVLTIATSLFSGAGWAQSPVDEGIVVRPINEPIVIRYRQFGKSPYLEQNRMILAFQGKDILSEIRGEIEGVPQNGGVRLITHIQKVIQNDKVVMNENTPPVRLYMDLSKLGVVHNVGVIGQPTVQKEFEKAPQSAKKMLGATYPILPDHVIKVGDRLKDTDFDFRGTTALTFNLTVLGQTTHLGRRAVVIGYGGGKPLAGGAVGEDYDARFSGYGLIDINTGMRVYSHLTMNIGFVENGQLKSVKASNISRVGLPSTATEAPSERPSAPSIEPNSVIEMTNKDLCSHAIEIKSGTAYWEVRSSAQKYVKGAMSRGFSAKDCADISGQSVKQTSPVQKTSPSKTGIEERLSRLKKLLSDGLISKEDAERKRKEILEDL